MTSIVPLLYSVLNFSIALCPAMVVVRSNPVSLSRSISCMVQPAAIMEAKPVPPMSEILIAM